VLFVKLLIKKCIKFKRKIKMEFGIWMLGTRYWRNGKSDIHVYGRISPECNPAGILFVLSPAMIKDSYGMTIFNYCSRALCPVLRFAVYPFFLETSEQFDRKCL
jgi:hypothetical protein